MKFKSKDHENVFLMAVGKAGCHRDPYRKALFYTLGIMESMSVINQAYDWEEGCIKPEVIRAGWQTSSSEKLTRLAFNLYNDGVPTAYRLRKNADKIDELMMNTPINIFSDYEDMEYMFEAVRIRFETV